TGRRARPASWPASGPPRRWPAWPRPGSRWPPPGSGATHPWRRSATSSRPTPATTGSCCRPSRRGCRAGSRATSRPSSSAASGCPWTTSSPRRGRPAPAETAKPGSAGLEGPAGDGAVDRRLGGGADARLVVGTAGRDRLLEADRADPDPVAADVVEDGLALVGAAGPVAGVGDPEQQVDLVLAALHRAEHGHGGLEDLAAVAGQLDPDGQGGEGKDGRYHDDQAGGAEKLALA